MSSAVNDINQIEEYLGSQAREMLDLVRRGHVQPIPIEERPLERAGETLDDLRADVLHVGPVAGRRGYDAPSDHFTRYELDLMQEQAGRVLDLDTVEGISLAWGFPGWSRTAWSRVTLPGRSSPIGTRVSP